MYLLISSYAIPKKIITSEDSEALRQTISTEKRRQRRSICKSVVCLVTLFGE